MKYKSLGREPSFQFIKWEDSEPYNIAELIEEYEDYQYKVDWHAEQLAKLSEVVRDKESEETEVKDKIWLKDSITRELQDLFSVSNPNYFDFEETNKKIRGLIDQLDEPKKPVVPEFVGEFIADYKEQGYTLANAIFNIATGREDMDIEEYLREHPKEFVQAYDDGYTVDEQKYCVRDDKGNTLLRKVTKGFGIDDRKGEIVTSTRVGETSVTGLTEKEIKDYDERFWPFRVPVEEEEE